MRISIVPAEMTSVKDKIIGNLELKQILLLATPLIFAIFTYIAIPPFNKTNSPKIILFIIFSFISSILSINISGELVLEIIINGFKYLIRPKIHLSTIKNLEDEILENLKNNEISMENSRPPEIKDRIKLDLPKGNVAFYVNRKGALNVRFYKQ
jgi:hypothetical protein